MYWSGERTIDFAGRHYAVKGLHPGPVPVHPIEIWVGAYRPRMQRLVGRLADGWVPSFSYAPPEAIPSMRRRIDEAAEDAGRDPAAIRRVYNLMGAITDDAGEGGLQGPPSRWVGDLTRFAVELGFDTFVFWPADDPVRQLERFAAEVIPGVREAVGAARLQTRP